MDDPALYHDELLEHTPALEQLSYYLTREEQSADDLVQETMITALERPPRHRENLGGWLHTVARNLALRGHRTKRRRERRETEAAQPESFKALDPAREEIMERVTRAVEELKEPYRTVIQMRFFDEMPPREIAAALTRPVKTVKSQLHRGLARLRIVLEKEFGDDEEIWAASLLALILPNAKTPPVAALATEEASTSAWTSVTWTLGGVAAALALVLIPLALRQSPRAIEPLARAASGAPANLSPTDLAPTPLAEKPMAATSTLAPIAPVQRKMQQVEAINSYGQPLRDGLIEIYRASGEFEAVGRTNEAGLLTFEVNEADYLQPLDFHDERPLPQELYEPSLGLRLAPTAEYSTSLVHWVGQASRATVVIETGRAPHVAQGIATDEMGFPLEGVEVRCFKLDRPRFRTKEGHLATLSPNRVTTDGRGLFAMDSLPDSLYWLIATKPGFAPAFSRQTVYDAESTQVEFVLRPAGSLRGRVTDESGLAVANASIRLLRDTGVEERTVLADSDGEYSFEDLPAGERLDLVAVADQRILREAVTVEPGEMRYLDFALKAPATQLVLELTDSLGLPAANRSFEAVAKYTGTPRGDGIRKGRAFNLVTSDAEGVIEHPPLDSLPDQLTLFPLNAVGVRLGAPVARIDLPRSWASRSRVTKQVTLDDLSQLSSARLRIVDERGRPLPDASLHARPLDGKNPVRSRRLPGDDGIWIRGIKPGRYEFFAQHPSRGQAFLKEVELKPADVRQFGDLALPACSTLIIDPHWWSSLPEVELPQDGDGIPIQFEVHQLTEWSGKPANYSIFREEAPRVSYEVLPGHYALRRVHGRQILDSTLIELQRIDGGSIAIRETE